MDLRNIKLQDIQITNKNLIKEKCVMKELSNIVQIATGEKMIRRDQDVAEERKKEEQ